MRLTPFSGKKINLLLALIGLLAFTSVNAQVASFTASVLSGCPSLPVTFTNTSTGTSGSASYVWDFGNGNGITTPVKTSPIGATYLYGGLFHVTLTVHDQGNTSVASQDILVYKAPVINFSSSPYVGCAPLPVSFTSVINPGDGTVVAANWDFGDGHTINSLTNPISNTYQYPGVFAVGLTVKNSFGCQTALKRDSVVRVYPDLVADFTADTTALCSLNQPANFLNLSSGNGSLSYIWTFGDGDSSTSTNPSHLYTGKGSFNVQLIVANTYGCKSDTLKKSFINVANFVTDFTSKNALCSGNTVLFVSSSTPAPSATPLWSFGDGGSGIGYTYGHSFAAGATYPVTMYVTFGGCVDSVTHNITILSSPALSPFQLDKGTSCSSPMTVAFTDTSSQAVSWHWNFDSNPADTSDLQDPHFTYVTNNLYSPTLTIANANGCTSTISRSFNTNQPTATIQKDTTLTQDATYCADVHAVFKATSTDTIATYLWSFGDGTTSTSANPTHDFTVPGTYIINLSFTTIHGCSGGALPPDTVIVYPKPKASFQAADSLPCTTNQTETFINLIDSSAKFTWYYGDGQSDVNNNIYHTHGYANSQLYQMILMASSPGCAPVYDTLNRFVKTTPIPKLVPVNNCDSDRLTVALTVTPGGGTQYIWSYGDGSPVETDNTYIATKNHHFPKGGVYTDSVNVLYGTCWQTTGPVKVYTLGKQKPVLSSLKDTICASQPLPVTISGLDTNYHSKALNIGTYYTIVKWQYGDGTTFNANTGFKTSYSGNVTGLVTGEDSIRAIIQSNYFGCYDTTNYIPIHTTGPVAGFSDVSTLCYHAPVIFTDSSKPKNNVPIVSWAWDFGDGNKVTDSTSASVQHMYAFPGTYHPKLTVTDSNGCTNSASLAVTQVLIYGAKANFIWKPQTITPNFPITFYNTTVKNTGVTYLWRFAGDGATSTNPDSVIHLFPNVGTDTVILIAYPSMPGACIDTLVVPLQIQNVAATFTYTASYLNQTNCPPLHVMFVADTLNTIGLHWDFGDGGTADNNAYPTHDYLYPGTYLVTLTGYGANGITVVTSDSVIVKGPSAKLYSSLDHACVPAVDTLHSTASYTGSYTWDFGDGHVTTTTDTLAVYTYTLPGLFTPTLILIDSTGCQTSTKYDHALLLDSLAAILPPSVVLCDTGSIKFGPYVKDFAADSLHYPLTYHWDFGTGVATDTANTYNPTFNYYTPGNFITSLTVSSPLGCTATTYDSVHVVGPFIMPVFKDTTICIGGSANLYADSAYSYNWSPASTLNKTTGDSVIATPITSTTYTVIGQDQLKCFLDTNSVTVKVDTLPVVTIPTPAPVLAGTDVQMDPVFSADVVSWDWTPPLYLNCTDCADPISTPLAPTTYSLTVKTASGCTATTTVTIKLLCLQNAVHMANAFSPNFDGNNDYFYPSGFGVKIVKLFQVYSRWGQLLYSKTDFPPNDKTYGWNGTLNGMNQPAGTYVYLAEMECFTGENFVLKGTVELLR